MTRRWISLATSLALLAQSLALAWMPAAHALPPPDAQPQQHEMAMPCHGDMAKAPADCCDDNCPMACAAHAVPPSIQLVTAPPASSNLFTAAPVPALLASHSLSPFRPPAR